MSFVHFVLLLLVPTYLIVNILNSIFVYVLFCVF